MFTATEEQKLRNAGWEAHGIAEKSEVQVIAVLGCNGFRVRELRRQWARERGIQFRPALQLREQRLATGFDALDTALNGGVRRGALTEIAGPAGSGKSQWCSQLAARCALTGPVVYIDTEGSFRPERVTQIAQERRWTDPSRILQNIFILRPPNADALLSALQTTVAESNALLVILDSVAAVARADFQDRVIDRQTWLANAAATLKHIASSCNAAVVVTNHVVADFATNSHKPALGLLWSHCVTTRCLFARDDALTEEEPTDSSPAKKRKKYRQTGIASIVKAPDVPNRRIPYTIDAAGLVDRYDDPPAEVIAMDTTTSTTTEEQQPRLVVAAPALRNATTAVDHNNLQKKDHL